jgi:hypothetical protein
MRTFTMRITPTCLYLECLFVINKCTDCVHSSKKANHQFLLASTSLNLIWMITTIILLLFFKTLG